MTIFRYGMVLQGIPVQNDHIQDRKFVFFIVDLVCYLISWNQFVEGQLLTLRTSGQNQDLHSIYYDYNICVVRQCGLDFGMQFSNNLGSWRRDTGIHDFWEFEWLLYFKMPVQILVIGVRTTECGWFWGDRA